ncbi:MAG: leucine-rich repeat domain-containing protein [Candidatus Poribacteria bacterium]|nr:leucine-rich repeat domain-containing protein [Candidatus Poribacteria bacterium]
MKKQILNQKTYVLIFTMLLVYGIHGIGYAGLEFAEGNSTTREIAENTPKCNNIGAPLRYSAEEAENCIDIWLRGPDAKSFAITLPFRGGVQLRTKSALNYEKKNFYKVTVSITDMEEPEDTDIITVNIIVTNVNETPFFSEEMDEAAVNRVHRSIPENTPVGISIGKPVSAIDPDGSDVVLTYSLSGYDANMFEIDNETGLLQTKMPLDYEAFEREPRTYFVDVEVSDGSASAKTEVWIHVEPVNEFAPIFIEGGIACRNIISTAEIGVHIGNPVLAIDMDAGETLEYSLDAAGTSAFEIDSRTGQLSNITELNYLTKPSHIVKIIVSDGLHTDSIFVTINVLSDIVDIPDSSLAWAIRRTLGLSASEDITMRAMSQLTTLHANRQLFRGRPVPTDLTGLEYATNLTHINLNGNRIADLTPIAGLAKLISLRLYNNDFSSLAPLAGLTSLKSLDISSNEINDITSLKGLTNLVELFVQLNEIQDVAPLNGMTNLNLLYLSENNVEDITALEDLTNLTQLYLQDNSIQDITPLKSLTDLETLYLTNNDIEDVTALEGLTDLKYLHLSYNHRLRDVSPLAGLVNLEILRLFGCPIEDTSPLEGLTADIDVLD